MHQPCHCWLCRNDGAISEEERIAEATAVWVRMRMEKLWPYNRREQK